MQRYILLLCLLLLWGCKTSSSSSSSSPQALRTCLASDIASFDPRKGVNMANQGVVRMLFTGLVRLDEHMVPQLELAEAYQTSSDFKTYTFTLKKCFWSNGSPITAYDFVQTWKGALTPAYFSANTNLFFVIKNGKQIYSGEQSTDQLGVKALDDRTLVVELEKPNPHFLHVLTNSIFSPVHSSMYNTAPDENHLICSGPFSLKKHIFQNQIILKKNPYYWNSSRVQLQELHYYIIKDPATALLMFDRQEIDWLGDPLIRISSDAIPSLKTTGLLRSSYAAGSQWLFLNTSKFPLNNPHIRQALAYAIDREKIMHDIIHADEYRPALGLISKILKKERWHPWFQDHDIAQARRAFQKGLQELGISASEFPTITISCASSYKIMEAIQQMIQEALGIKVAIETLDTPILISRCHSHNFEMMWGGWLLQYNDPANMLEIFKYKNVYTNYSSWENPQFIQYANACYSATTEEEKWAHVEAAEKIFSQEMPSIPVADFISFYLEQPYVKGVFVNQLLQIDFDRAFIEKTP